MATKDKPPTMTRAEVTESIDRGEHVGTRTGQTLRERSDVDDAFPTRVADNGTVHETKEIEAVVIRDENGRLTRAGMEWAIRAGGSVMWGGKVITDLDKLPDEVEMARQNERAQFALARSLDSQMANLAAQRAQLDAPAATPAAAHAPAHATHAAHKPDKK